VLVENADQERDEAGLWRLLDLARARQGAVLLTGSSPPQAWEIMLPDLRSRLQATPIARLEEPDEALLEVVLRRLCREQFILLSDDAVQFLARRMPRTFAAAHALAAALDRSIVKGARPATVADAKRALEIAQKEWAHSPEGG
jgi:chromosomal replication initiation ATPase DnaA